MRRDYMRDYSRNYYAKNRAALCDYARERRADPTTGARIRKAANDRYNKCPETRKNKKLRTERSRLKRQYGITIEERAAMFAAQGSKCAICGTSEAKWHIDHCHKTKKIRGILCSYCNSFIGHLEHSEERTKAAFRYLST